MPPLNGPRPNGCALLPMRRIIIVWLPAKLRAGCRRSGKRGGGILRAVPSRRACQAARREVDEGICRIGGGPVRRSCGHRAARWQRVALRPQGDALVDQPGTPSRLQARHSTRRSGGRRAHHSRRWCGSMRQKRLRRTRWIRTSASRPAMCLTRNTSCTTPAMGESRNIPRCSSSSSAASTGRC